MYMQLTQSSTARFIHILKVWDAKWMRLGTIWWFIDSTQKVSRHWTCVSRVCMHMHNHINQSRCALTWQYDSAQRWIMVDCRAFSYTSSVFLSVSLTFSGTQSGLWQTNLDGNYHGHPEDGERWVTSTNTIVTNLVVFTDVHDECLKIVRGAVTVAHGPIEVSLGTFAQVHTLITLN